jgi:exopolyphosphatase/guanosine-5'-triphosphate,3'-diphosphate pyrophosphatase
VPYFVEEMILVRIAAIDIGTNSTRLLVVDEKADHLQVVRQELTPTRLGQGLGESRSLLPEAQERTARAVAEFYTVARSMGSSAVRVFATSAVRDAVNREEFLSRIQSEIGLRPEVLNGETEARFSFLGATRAVGVQGRILVVDVGGGSTELVWGEKEQVAVAWSLNIGAVRLTETYLKTDPATEGELRELRAVIRSALRQVEPVYLRSETKAVAVGGTATTLAAMGLGLKEYSPDKVQGFILSAQDLRGFLLLLASLPVAERKGLPGLPAARADIILAGTMILQLVQERLELGSYIVSDADSLLGSLYDLRAGTSGNERT